MRRHVVVVVVVVVVAVRMLEPPLPPSMFSKPLHVDVRPLYCLIDLLQLVESLLSLKFQLLWNFF